MVFCLALSLFFTEPAPLELPRAEAYFVEYTDNSRRLEDRYNPLELWTSRAVIGRWHDDDDRTFVLSRLDMLPPALRDEGVMTRVDYLKQAEPAEPKNPDHLARQVDALSPVPPAAEFARLRPLPRGYKDILYCQGTNTATLVCAFRPEADSCWWLAVWELAAGDDFEKMREAFEREFLGKREWSRFAPKPPAKKKSARKVAKDESEALRERKLLQEEARHSVAAYDNWHVAEAEEFSILDDLPTRKTVEAITNELPQLRSRYAAALPTTIDVSNTLAVARIYADRDEYLTALSLDDDTTNMVWSAAYWCPTRRELVANLPPEGERELQKTFRHEAFHQYLSYATAFLTTSPWLNEGYAQYFEDENSTAWDLPMDNQRLERMAELLPSLLLMDYKTFYAGSDRVRHLKYRAAWSIAVFLEKGADKVRLRPFRNLKADYMAALFKTHDMRKATEAAFGNPDTLALFVAEWKRFWHNM